MKTTKLMRNASRTMSDGQEAVIGIVIDFY